MKKSKFLLLGSVASLASIPFVAAKCGETKEEKKPEEGKNPGGDKNPGGNTEPGKNPSENTEPGKNPSENTEPGKNPDGDKNPEASKKPEGENQAEPDEEPKEEVEKAYQEAVIEWEQAGGQGSVNHGIGWGEDHFWGIDDEKGTVGNPGAESGTKAKDSKTESGTKEQDQ